MSEKKRKRAIEDNGEVQMNKAVRHVAPNVKFSAVNNLGTWEPIIASTPGLEIQDSTSLDVFMNNEQSYQRGIPPELLLHSSSHPKLDYIAREEGSGSADALLKHFLGVYDPIAGSVKVFPARKMVIRSILRTTTTIEEDVDEVMPKKGYGARVLLGEAFGTKKSQKALRAMTENAIASPADKHNDDGKPVLNAPAAAILDTVAHASSSMPNKIDLQASTNEAKPRPKANLTTSNPREVYVLENLVGSSAFSCLDIKSWSAIAKKGRRIHTTSQFVSRHVERLLIEEGEPERSKALQFLLFLIQWYKCLRTTGRDGKKLPRKEDVQKAVPGANERLLEILRTRFASNMTLSRWDIDFLITHICALAIVLDLNCTTDIYYLQEDLGLELRQLSQYFQELGCKILKLSESDRKAMGWSKAVADTHRIARLQTPLTFPEVRLHKIKAR